MELVPPEIASLPAVKRDAERRGKKAKELLLDSSLHHSA
ncbi:MAG TPA: 16S rRNA methyltransferase, partial [Thermoplasmatales archaeon]|nr:16S rRNA methyltransferase [Thermoplasmatales archaeon]